MQISHDDQINHYKKDLYDLDIELKTAAPSINPHENMNLGSWGICLTTSCNEDRCS